MMTITEYKTLHRRLRTTAKGDFGLHMEVVSRYRQAANQWNLPLPEWHSLHYQSKNTYNPWRKFSVILKKWSAIDNFEF